MSTTTTTAESTRQVHWTTFPASALTDRDGAPVDWTDHRAAHRAVSRLFPSRLPGDAEARRAGGGILYRLEEIGGEPSVLVQSTTPPELVPAGRGTREVPPEAWTFEEGARVAFRVAVNPVRRTTRHYEDAAKKVPTHWSNQRGNRDLVRHRGHRKQTAQVIPLAEFEAWLVGKLESALTEIEILDHRRDTTGSGAHRLVVDTVDGLATVRSPSALDTLRVAGVGRAKAYGCGLLTVARFGGMR